MKKYELITNYLEKFDYLKGANGFNAFWELENNSKEDMEYNLNIAKEIQDIYCSNFRVFEELGLREHQRILVSYINDCIDILK